MNFLRIGKHAVKISLNSNEAQEYRILESMSLDSAEIKEAFSRLLNKAKETVDFSYAGRKIFTEIFPSNDGGCEIFISCINIEEGVVYKDKNQTRALKSKEIISIYDFDNLLNLLSVASRLREINYNGNSSIYYDLERKRYFMILEDASPKDIKYAFIQEYAKYIKTNASSYVKEHYQCVIKKDGVGILSALA